MAFHGICQCFRNPEQWFGGITCTDGRGSARNGVYEEMDEDLFARLRAKEQTTAAEIGCYSFVAQLGFTSQAMKSPADSEPARQLAEIIAQASPQILYTHNPFDRHPTHLAVLRSVLQALEWVPAAARPKVLLCADPQSKIGHCQCGFMIESLR
ncbi:MAG: PIG-L family deacetylase, partial [Verrucomicrobiia bacterium]